MFSAATKSARVATAANYIEDVFSTYLYTPASSNINVNVPNGVDLSTYGGMTWIKNRGLGTSSAYHCLVDTVRGGTNVLHSNLTTAAYTANIVSSFNTNGFTTGDSTFVSNGGYSFASWTFRKQPKFFDVVTWTGDGLNNRWIDHSLASTPGAIIIKRTDTTSNWVFYHRSLFGYGLFLNTTAAETSANSDNGYVSSTSATQFRVSYGAVNASNVNASGGTYVAYLFAHNAGGFGLTGTDNVISCGSFTAPSSGSTTVTLGYEPQWVLFKDATSATNWYVVDSMRGMTANGDNARLFPNLSSNESPGSGLLSPTATGFTFSSGFFSGGDNIIYIAIRRGPMKTPTSGTSIYGTQLQVNTPTYSFPPDLIWATNRTGNATYSNWFVDRLRGSGRVIRSYSTGAETAESYSTFSPDGANNSWGPGWTGGADYEVSGFRRAPGFFDEVCYTGDNVSGRTVQHNLGTAPDLVFVKCRSTGPLDWYAYGRTGNTNQLAGSLNNTWAFSSFAGFSGFTQQPTSQYLYLSSGADETNGSGKTYVAYLFGSVAGVSKVGTYTGTGATQTINCGFTGGARFVLIKRTDSTGDWYVYDTARGMTTLTDPYLLLNSTAAESATLGSVTTVSTGFALNASILAAINTNGASYIFLAIA